ncbi:PcfJ domain-containing protein [Lysinibacillus parviboronicapiens]|uniref:PcfJ domain-containing protein n=1 Tax=Lysinibacillus parviboronicapiens TaxID=436516 RepID=UPI003F69D81A
MFNYAQKQFELSSKHYASPSQVLVTWSDYIGDCQKLELNLDDEVVLYPKNLKKAHARTIKLIKIKNDEVANLKIQKRYENLNTWCLNRMD